MVTKTLAVLTKVLAGLMMMLILVLTAYTAYGQWWAWGAIKQEQQRLDAIEQKLNAQQVNAPTGDVKPSQPAPVWGKKTVY